MPPAPATKTSMKSLKTATATAERVNESCACRQRAAKFCRDCALAYCEPCCAKRHAKGSFLRHTTVDVTTAADNDELLTSSASPLDKHAPSMCEECLLAPAVLECKACELSFCANCSSDVHKIGTMQSHVDSGSFAFFSHAEDVEPRASLELPTQQTPSDKHQHVDPGSLPTGSNTSGTSEMTGRDAFGLKAAVIRDGEATETPLVDPDQEVAPCSPALTKDDADAESYDLWSSWSVRSFSDRSLSIDSTSQWRNLRSLSIDSTPPSATNASGDDELPLTSISKSLQSLQVFASPSATEEIKVASKSSPQQLFAQRQRSYSDYTSLRSHASADLWQESSAAGGASANRSSSAESVTSSSPVYTTPSPASAELWRAMKTNFPSRHLLIKSTTTSGSFDAADVQRISGNLNHFGSVARVRDEFASDGLLFFTYFELKCAIGAVKSWFSDTITTAAAATSSSPISFSPSRSAFPGSEVVHFCLPYELPDEFNCATLLVRLNGPPVTSTEMRQFCSRYGEVASVLQNDINSSKYILEYNDARDVPAAISGLSSSFHATGSSISAVRTSPPTLDIAKIQLFQKHLDSVVTVARMASLGPRPTSFSSSTASLLTSSPTSTSSSPMNPSPSFLEISSHASDSIEAVVANDARATSPFDGGIYQMRNSASALSDEHQIWSGSSSNVSATSSSSTMRPRSSSSSLIGLGSATSSASSQYSNPYSTAMAAVAVATGSGTFPPYMSSNLGQQQHDEPVGAVFHQQHLQQRLMLASGGNKYGAPVRSGSDPSFRSSGSNFGGNSNMSGSSGGYHSGKNSNPSGIHTVVIGRNDQGIGEFSLSIERVASGGDKRTTLMIRNIPNKYTQQMLLAEINQRHRGNYDFFYLPIDFKNKCNMGYAFINFMEAESIIPFYKEFDSQKWTNFNSEKVCAISYARLQGKQAMIARFQNSSLLDKHESYRPLVFVSSGANRGRPETFPAPKQPQHHHHKKQMLHPHHHHHLMMGGMPDEFGGAGGRMYMQNHQHHHQQQQQQQQLQAMHQFMAAQHSHAAAGLHGLAMDPQGANLNLHMNFHGLAASAHHLQQQQQVPTYQHYQQHQHQHQEHHMSAAAKTMSLAFGGAAHHTSTSFSP